MPGYNSPRRGTARTIPITFLCCSVYCFFFVLLYVLFFFFGSFCVLFVCKCVLYYCHWVSTQLQLTNISIYQYINIQLKILFTNAITLCQYKESVIHIRVYNQIYDENYQYYKHNKNGGGQIIIIVITNIIIIIIIIIGHRGPVLRPRCIEPRRTQIPVIHSSSS
jgi:hypothetical protein